MTNILTTGLVGLTAGLGISEIVKQSMLKYDSDIINPIDTVSIIMPSYNEESFIETSVLSIKDQSIIQQYPQYFEFILADSNSTDKTVTIAKSYVDKIILSPRGKLTARNIAINMATGNIIVSVDADSYYPPHWLNTLLKPFSKSTYLNIVGVNGSTIDYTITNIPKFIRNIMELADKRIHTNKMLGRNSAFYKHAYYLAGTFDENINQLDVKSMVKEEEIGFGNRLSKIGKIIQKMNASCIHLGGQKIACRWNLENKDICKSYEIGKNRF